MAAFGGAIVAQSLDVAFASLTIRVRGRGRIRDSVRTIAPVVFAASSLYAPVVVLLALCTANCLHGRSCCSSHLGSRPNDSSPCTKTSEC